MIKVLVVDDHPVVRAGLAGMMSRAEGIEVVGEAGDGEEAVTRVAELAPDVVLMDLRMPGRDGVWATQTLTAQNPDVAILVLTTFDTDGDIVRAVEAGATGYLLKDTPHDELLEGVRAAARHETVLAPPVAARLLSQVRSPGPTATPSPRELEVLGGVARGLSNPEIAAELFIGEATVKTHLQRVYAKFDVDDRTHAVTVAMERGLLPVNPS